MQPRDLAVEVGTASSPSGGSRSGAASRVDGGRVVVLGDQLDHRRAGEGAREGEQWGVRLASVAPGRRREAAAQVPRADPARPGLLGHRAVDVRDGVGVLDQRVVGLAEASSNRVPARAVRVERVVLQRPAQALARDRDVEHGGHPARLASSARATAASTSPASSRRSPWQPHARARAAKSG